jgi:hypothetical protein
MGVGGRDGQRVEFRAEPSEGLLDELPLLRAQDRRVGTPQVPDAPAVQHERQDAAAPDGERHGPALARFEGTGAGRVVAHLEMPAYPPSRPGSRRRVARRLRAGSVMDVTEWDILVETRRPA